MIRINASHALIPVLFVLSVFAGGNLAEHGSPGAHLAQSSQAGENLRALLLEQREAWIGATCLKIQGVS